MFPPDASARIFYNSRTSVVIVPKNVPTFSRGIGVLNRTKANSAKPADKPYTLSDIKGLFLHVGVAGRKYWRFRYTNSDGKRSWHTIGEYPAMSIDEARNAIPELQRRADAGLPFVDEPKAVEEVDEIEDLFSTVAAEWADYNDTRSITAAGKQKARSCLMRYVMPHFENIRMSEITPPMVLSLLEGIALDDKPRVVSMAKSIISNIFRYAAVRGIVMYDPCTMLKGAIMPKQATHYRSIREPKELAPLLSAINGYHSKLVRLALTFQIYSMVRHGEMRAAEWTELDMERREWRIPSSKMKKRREHIVPLTDQLIAIIDAMRPINGDAKYIFASPRTRGILSDSPFEDMLRKIGYRDQVTPHGFRSTASTILNEHGYDRDWIERQLAHVEESSVRGIYNYADYLDDRRKMLQWYGDFLDELRGEPMNLK